MHFRYCYRLVRHGAHAAAAAASAEDPAALRAELRRAQGSHVPAVLCRAASAVLPAATRTGSVQGKCWILCSWRRGVWALLSKARSSAEHGAVEMMVML
jgi:hypothetical protein